MSISSFNGMKLTYHREHKDYDFVKLQKGELKVTVEEGDVYVCNQTCFADWIYLYSTYSPIFTKIVIYKPKNGETKVGLRKMGAFETIMSAIGIKFPEEVTEEPRNVYYSIKQLKEEDGLLCYKNRRPVVIFPEGTKTNGCGILNIDDGVIKLIHDAA
jgi:1-acyl-sn-glycerol-3-phosphate acyltransferase